MPVYRARVYGRTLPLENPARESAARAAHARKQAEMREMRERKQKIGNGMSRQEAKTKGLWRLTPEQAKFVLFIPLHQLWMGYMSELLGLRQRKAGAPVDAQHAMPGIPGMHAKLVKADFHGSIITVRQSKHPGFVGLSGIVIHESENAFRVVTRKNQTKCTCFLIPKQNNVFAFSVPLYSTLDEPHQPDTPLPISAEGDTTTVEDIPHMEFELYGNQFQFRSSERVGRKFKHKTTIEL
ncbi:hypothetical protein FISHEDRAFT_67811 [Fistulina hepatica ATCC 64428]|nr:hypothetical protein FISHEDRAFT_67811 [Fistulina hepatica ATCC 64428]